MFNRLVNLYFEITCEKTEIDILEVEMQNTVKWKSRRCSLSNNDHKKENEEIWATGSL
jgi:hypothetical protein